MLSRNTLAQSDRSKRLASTVRYSLAFAVLVTACVGGTCAVAQDMVREGGKVELNNTIPFEQRGVSVDQNLGDEVPLNLPLIDANGKPAKTGYFIDGRKPTIVTLNYSNCPMLCNIQLTGLTNSLNKLDLKIGRDFRILTVSIDPTESTKRIAETKQLYVKELIKNHPNVAEGWEFCTARQPIITRLAKVLGFNYKYDRANKQYNHPAMLAFVSPEGVISRYSLKVDFPPKQLRMALVEAGEGTVGSKVDQFILWCYSYDPDSNSYTPMAFRIMKLAGATTICLMLACLAPYWVGRKRDPNEQQSAESDESDLSDENSNTISE